MLPRKSAEEELASYHCRILVCSGTGCIATGSNKIHEIFQELVDGLDGIKLEFAPHDKHEHEKMGVKKTGCQGFCELGPLVRIQKGNQVVQYVKVQPEDCREILEQTVLGDTVIQRLLYSKGDTHYVSPDEIPFIAKQTRIVLENCGKVDAESLDEYLAAGGFRALEKAMFDMTRDEVIDEVDKSGLRGEEGIKEAVVPYNGMDVKICVVSGLANARKVMEQVQSGEKEYHLIEVMACRRGCIMGGGQPIPAGPRHKAARAAGLYSADGAMVIKKSDENPLMDVFYNGYFKGKAHELLHNHR